MPVEPLLALRRSLLLALGLGACTGNPEPVPPGGTSPRGAALEQHGYVREPDGTVHRAGAEVCDPTYEFAACERPGAGYNECTSASECTRGAYPQCVQAFGQIGEFCRCDYSCKTDADCAPDQVCVCGGALGDGRHAQCVPAHCRADAECGDGVCGLSSYFNGCSTQVQLACRTAADACKNDGDCTDGQHCVFDEQAARWDCRGLSCIIGRPLLVDGAARTAPTVARGDWLTELDLPRDLPPEIRAALADHWAAVAALEHASVASFAAFTLDLMTLAAPPELLVEAQRAALDEIEHARLAWSLASLWAGRALGPGALSLDGLPKEHVLRDIVVALVREGCVGETLGAAEAQFCAELAHPTLAPWLATLAHDEARHAALAWRTLRWLLATRGPEVRAAALTTIAELRAELAAPGLTHDDTTPEAPLWGLLRRSELLAHRRETFATVVEP
ncbi:MAG TPA: ferritin-like domain-containing protein, partial [Nannocystis sp.]